MFLRRNEFLKFLGGVQRFWRLFCKRKATGEANAYKQQNGKSSMQPTQNPFSSSKSCVCTDVIQLCHLVIDWPSIHAIALLQHSGPSSGMLREINFGRPRDNFQRKILQENVKDNRCYGILMWIRKGKQTLGNEEFETFPVHSPFCFEFLKHRDHLIYAELLWPESNQSSGLVSMFSQTQTSDCCVNHFEFTVDSSLLAIGSNKL